MNEIKQKGSSGSGIIYGLGFIGSLIYFILNANSFLDGIAGFFNSLVWPALLVYKLLVFLT
jgi:hypothetical protein